MIQCCANPFRSHDGQYIVLPLLFALTNLTICCSQLLQLVEQLLCTRKIAQILTVAVADLINRLLRTFNIVLEFFFLLGCPKSFFRFMRR